MRLMLTRVVNRHPVIQYLAWRVIPHLPFLLPHDKTYLGFRHLVVKGKRGMFLDVGANVGISAMGFRRINSDYRILSIEPNPALETRLAALKQQLGQYDYMMVAAGRGHAELNLFVPVYRGLVLHTSSSLSEEHLQQVLTRFFPSRMAKRFRTARYAVRVIPLDDLNLEPDIIKIDAEGYDFEVMAGLSRTIGSHRPYLLIEYSPVYGGHLADFCRQFSYKLFIYHPDQDVFVPFQASREDMSHQQGTKGVNVFAIPVEKLGGLPVHSPPQT